MKYSVNGNHLNTHIVNMCCCSAINRVLITPFLSMSPAHFFTPVLPFRFAQSLFFVHCTAVACHSDMLDFKRHSNAMKRKETCMCVCVMLHNIGRNRAQTSNRQLFDTTIEFAKSQKSDSIAVSRSCSHPIHSFSLCECSWLQRWNAEIFMWIC